MNARARVARARRRRARTHLGRIAKVNHNLSKTNTRPTACARKDRRLFGQSARAWQAARLVTFSPAALPNRDALVCPDWSAGLLRAREAKWACPRWIVSVPGGSELPVNCQLPAPIFSVTVTMATSLLTNWF